MKSTLAELGGMFSASAVVAEQGETMSASTRTQRQRRMPLQAGASRRPASLGVRRASLNVEEATRRSSSTGRRWRPTAASSSNPSSCSSSSSCSSGR